MSLVSPRRHSKSTPRHSSIFYKTDEIRFRGFATRSYKKLPRPQYLFENSPWLSINNQQIEVLMDRLEDKPQQLYKTIEQRDKKGKFILLKSSYQKQNLKLIRELQTKKQNYEEQFRSILRNRKPQALTIILPKLEGLSYIYGDNLHLVEKKKTVKGRTE